jgi:hypothetical protein
MNTPNHTREVEKAVAEYRSGGRELQATIRVGQWLTEAEIDAFVDTVLGSRLAEAIANLGDHLDEYQVRGAAAREGFIIDREDWPAIWLAYRTTHEFQEACS